MFTYKVINHPNGHGYYIRRDLEGRPDKVTYLRSDGTFFNFMNVNRCDSSLSGGTYFEFESLAQKYLDNYLVSLKKDLYPPKDITFNEVQSQYYAGRASAFEELAALLRQRAGEAYVRIADEEAGTLRRLAVEVGELGKHARVMYELYK